MDFSVWLPRAWGMGAAVCGAALWYVQPWRRQFHAAWRVCRGLPVPWLTVALVVPLEELWRGVAPAQDGVSISSAALPATADSLAGVLTWIARGEVSAVLVAVVFLLNGAGVRSGLLRGLRAGFPRIWRWVLPALLVSIFAALAVPVLRFSGAGDSLVLAVKLMASLWTVAAATLLMAWLTLSLQPGLRPRSRSRSPKARPAEQAGEVLARFWPLVLCGAVAFPLLDLISPGGTRLFLWPLAALVAWLPFTTAAGKEPGKTRAVMARALRRAGGGLLPFCGWLAVAGMVFFAFHLLAGALLSPLIPAGTPWRTAVSLLFSGLGGGLSVWMLGAWVAMQMDSLPSSPIRVARVSRPRHHA